MKGDRQFVVTRCWSEGDWNCRSSLAFSSFEKQPKSGRFEPELADRPPGEQFSDRLWRSDPAETSSLRKHQKPQRGPPVRIPFAPATRHCEPTLAVVSTSSFSSTHSSEVVSVNCRPRSLHILIPFCLGGFPQCGQLGVFWSCSLNRREQLRYKDVTIAGRAQIVMSHLVSRFSRIWAGGMICPKSERLRSAPAAARHALRELLGIQATQRRLAVRRAAETTATALSTALPASPSCCGRFFGDHR
jgi:hypothetical protein